LIEVSQLTVRKPRAGLFHGTCHGSTPFKSAPLRSIKEVAGGTREESAWH
jgi:hypothetical protein